jgi:hypothetical protein
MSNLRGLTIAAAVMLTTACTDGIPSAPEPASLNFRADVETLFKGRFPLNPPPGGVPNACTGENVLVSGTYNLIVRMVTTSSGETQFRVHVSGNVTGIGATTGTVYQSNEFTNLTQIAGPNGSAVFHFRFQTQSVSRGPLANSTGVIQIQLTVNANGTVSVDRELYEFDTCRG